MSTIFVSSTFQDMQQERDVLQNTVLPRLKEFAKQYGKNIDLCDLRWGINSLGMSEAESTAKVLQVCFDEIDQARPLFIAILGDRYGWIPDPAVVKNSITGRNIDASDLLDKSVTEMEIQYGAFENSNPSDVRFYFREIKNGRIGVFANSNLPSYFFSESSNEKKRMKSLKAKIVKRFRKQVRTYSVSWNKTFSKLEGMDLFAEMLYQDIKDMLVQRWGKMPKLTEYEYQFLQYQYAIDCDTLLDDESVPLLSSNTNPDNLKLNDTKMHTQIYLLVSQDEPNLNVLFSTLCRRYQNSGVEVIPYECSQSLKSSAQENLLCYYASVLENKSYRKLGLGTKKDTRNNGNTIKSFNKVLDELDAEIDSPIILAIRNIQYLDGDNVFEWLPVKKYQHIHFLLSCESIFSAPSLFKEIASEFYFHNYIFSRRRLITSYMSQYHKELDDQVYDALLDKSANKNDQYLELLMQRLLVLSQADYEAIKNSGDGMEKISLYLQKVIAEAPDSIPDFMLEQVSLLKTETSSSFVKVVLAILSILPYGISRTDLNNVLRSEKVTFSTLDMTLLCRRLPNVVTVTIDGYYRMTQSQVSSILTEDLVIEKAEWTIALERYMSQHPGNAEQAVGRYASEFYRSQYLELAVKTGRTDALGTYLKNIGFDATYFGRVLYKLSAKQDLLLDTFKPSFSKLSFSAKEWMAEEVYKVLSEKKMLLDRTFTSTLIGFWEEMRAVLIKAGDTSGRNNYCLFMVLYELGEMMYLSNIDNAEKYLIEAKKVSKDNFSKYPNRIWKVLHGIELTEEEKKRGYDALDVPESSDIMFGFHGEIEDMEFEQSWSDIVRIINNYLSQIYHRKGNINAAENLEKDSSLISHISDPDPQHQGRNELVSGITVIWPDEIDKKGKDIKKRRYKPDLRRNSALQIGKEAQKHYAEGKYIEAVEKYTESNEILQEIYEDGCTGEYYDLDDVIGNAYDLRIMIQKECARDLSLNYYDMLGCTVMNENDSRTFDYTDSMLEWAHIYDDYRNNMQSKESLEDDYLLSATIYFNSKNRVSFRDRIIRDIDRYYTYRLEAHMKGETTDEAVMQNRSQANAILYKTVISDPEIASSVTDILLKQSNASVKANDFNGFLSLTELMENLLKWMWKKSYDWRGSACSLESIFFHNISNQCMLWEKHHMYDRLKRDAERIGGMLSSVSESENALLGMESILRYAMHIFRSGEYKDTIPYADIILENLQRTDVFPDIELANIYEKLLAMYSEAELLDKAFEVAFYNEALLEEMERKGYTEELRTANITPAQYRTFVITKMIISYINHAVALSRMEDQDEAEKYLGKAEKLAAKYPEIAASEVGIMQRITLFRKNGLPKPKREKDSERIYRKYKNEIETVLEKCMRREAYDVSVLQHVVDLIEKMANMPEYAIFKDTYTIAKYYHVLSMLFVDADRKDQAFKMLVRAAKLAESDETAEELYAEIYSDMCGYVTDSGSKLSFSRKALAIYKTLQVNGKDYSQNSYAMALYNSGVIYLERGEYKNALEYARKADYIWNRLLQSTTDEQIRSYHSEAQRLIAVLEWKIRD